MDYKYLADLLFPDLTMTIDDVEAKYPVRTLSEGAIVTRMAPSPTGFVHLGNLVQGLTAERMAHQSNGILFLRVEDTDAKREVPGAVEVLIETLKHYGISFDEGATIDGDAGDYGPYRQRQRAEIYHVFAKKLITEGRIGELTFIESEYAHNYANARGHNDWRMVPERHGFIGGGCHAVDLLRWLAGDPIEVYAYENHKSLMDWPTADTAIAIYKFPNDVMGKVMISNGTKRSYTMRSVFYGTKGTIIAQNKMGEVILFEDAEGKNYHDEQIIEVPPKDHNAEDEIGAFVDAIINNKRVPVPAVEGASTVAVACATVKSTETGDKVQIRYPEI
jgi:hypothetical protein